jgi:hypothetical protein
VIILLAAWIPLRRLVAILLLIFCFIYLQKRFFAPIRHRLANGLTSAGEYEACVGVILRENNWLVLGIEESAQFSHALLLIIGGNFNLLGSLEKEGIV